ncbi:MAG: ABC transporter substrate-binding protein, partial [Microcystaceae cyanobacterium]
MKRGQFLFNFVIGLGLTIVCCLILFVAKSQAEPVTLSVLLAAPELTELRPIFEKFEATHPKIRFNLVEGPNSTNQIEDLYTSSFLLGNSSYDLVYMDIVWVPKLAAAGWLLDLSDNINEAQLSAFLSQSVEGGRYKGQLYWLPFRSGVGILYYRPDILKEAGYNPPETFEDLLTISQAIQEKGLTEWGYVWQGKQYEGLSAMFIEILQGHGAFWINPDTLEVGLDQPEAIQAVEFLRDTLTKRVSPPGVSSYAEEETRLLFQNGKVAFLRNWPYVFGFASQPDSPIKGKLAMKPMVHAPGYQSGSCQGGWGIGISATSPHPKEAWEVIQFMVSEDVERDFILRT